MSPRPRPSESFEGVLPAPERNPLALPLSVLAHGMLILVILLMSKKLQEKAAEEARSEVKAPDRSVQMVYVPPPVRAPAPAPTPTAEPAQPTPPVPVPVPPRVLRPPEPEPNAPTESKPADGPEEPLPRTEQPAGETDGKAPENTNAPVDAATALNASMEAEAARIFGRRRGANNAEGGPVATRPFANAKIPDSKCPEIPRDSTGVPVQGEVRGRVVDQDTGRPLSNAHLQMVGHQYNTFADQDGSFTLKFDLMLMADCRTQWVNITAPGHRPQVLPIVMGGGISTVPLRRR